jgi:hypothetical protein
MVSTSEYSFATGVAARLAMWTLSAKGEIRKTVFVEYAIRGALLIDLTIADSIALEDELIIITEPVGYAPADLALAELDARSEWSLDNFMVHGTVNLRHVIAELVAASLLHRRRASLGLGWRYDCLWPEWRDDDSYSAAAAKTLADKVGLITKAAAAPDGPASWMLEAVLELLEYKLVNRPVLMRPESGFAY